MSRKRKIGTIITKDPDEVLPYEIEWKGFEDIDIDQSDWAVELVKGDASNPLTVEDGSIDANVTTVVLSGAAVGAKWKVTNTIQFAAHPYVKQQSFYVLGRAN